MRCAPVSGSLRRRLGRGELKLEYLSVPRVAGGDACTGIADFNDVLPCVASGEHLSEEGFELRARDGILKNIELLPVRLAGKKGEGMGRGCFWCRLRKGAGRIFRF